MASLWSVCLCAMVSCVLLVSVLADPSPRKDVKDLVGGHRSTQLNTVTKQCVYGTNFYRGCMRCVCEASMTAEQRSQFPAHQLRVCAGEIAHTDCPSFTCATSKQHLAVTECEGRCTCDEATKITTCERLPCPYE